MLIRHATLDDAERILEIYSYYVESTAISFEYTTPTISEFKERINKITQSYPYLVVEDNGVIQGYAYAHPFIERDAYRFCCETTIYLDKNAKKKGYGKALYEALEAELKKAGIKTMYACIGVTNNPDEYLTNNSAEFHEHIGFKLAGEFKNCGYKFGRWYSMIWMGKDI